MDVSIRHNPAFAVARLTLAPSESARLESGAMMATSAGVESDSKMEGGLLKGLKRSVLGGESFFVSRYTAPTSGGWVDCAARLPGDVTVIPLEGALNLSRGAWLASSDGVEIDAKWGGFKNLVGGEGGFVVRATGQGPVVAACYGALDVVTVAAGEQYVLDSGHMVAFSDGMQFTTRMVNKGIMQTLKSGEGFVFEFTGPGQVWTQSRNPSEFIAWMTSVLPFSRG